MNTYNFTDPEAKNWLIGILKEAEVLVKFRKVDGTERVMKCTLNESLMLPLPSEKETTRTKKTNDNVLAVYDMEKESWRSFRLDSIIGVEFTLGR